MGRATRASLLASCRALQRSRSTKASATTSSSSTSSARPTCRPRSPPRCATVTIGVGRRRRPPRLAAPTITSATARMRVVNADGSVPEMCGNGLRCVALHRGARAGTRVARSSHRHRRGPPPLRGRRRTADAAIVTVDMGVVRVTGDLTIDARATATRLRHAGRRGQPARVLLGDLRAAPTSTRLGPRLAEAPGFPRGTNVEFARGRRARASSSWSGSAASGARSPAARARARPRRSRARKARRDARRAHRACACPAAPRRDDRAGRARHHARAGEACVSGV